LRRDVDTDIQPQTLAISPDGYIRLSLANVSAMPFLHLFSEVNDDLLEELQLQLQAVPARLAGFSEWKSNTSPAISIGWGWFIHSRTNRVCLAPDGVRSNVMLIDALGYDLGALKTSNLFCSWLSNFEWQHFVSSKLRRSNSC
jgi:hypothetical protein